MVVKHIFGILQDKYRNVDVLMIDDILFTMGNDSKQRGEGGRKSDRHKMSACLPAAVMEKSFLKVQKPCTFNY